MALRELLGKEVYVHLNSGGGFSAKVFRQEETLLWFSDVNFVLVQADCTTKEVTEGDRIVPLFSIKYMTLEKGE